MIQKPKIMGQKMGCMQYHYRNMTAHVWSGGAEQAVHTVQLASLEKFSQDWQAELAVCLSSLNVVVHESGLNLRICEESYLSFMFFKSMC